MRIFSRRYSSSRNPYARRWMTRIWLLFVSHILDRALATATTDVPREALRVVRVVRQKAQSFALHAAIASTADPTSFEFEVNPYIAVRQISNATHPAIVDRAPSTTSLASRFFERRTSVTTRAMRSPKTPRSASQGPNPSNRYASDRRLSLREVAIAKSCPISRGHQDAQTLAQIGSPTFSS